MSRAALLGSTAQLMPPPPHQPPLPRPPETTNAKPSKPRRAPRRSRRQPKHRNGRRDTGTDQDSSDAPDQLVPDPEIAAEFSVSLMTLWRWSRDATLNFPPPVKINGRNYRSRAQIETFK